MKPRVLVATNMYPSTGDPARGAFVRAQVDALRTLDVPVELFAVHGDRRALNYARAIQPLRAAVHAFAADLVYAFYGLTGWLALWQPRPVVLSLAGDDILGTPNRHGGVTTKSRVGVGLSQWAAHRAEIVCVQSEEMKNRLWGAELRRRALVIPYGVDPGRFHPGDQDQARRRLGLPIGLPLVIFPNTPTEPRKRLDLASKAMDLVGKDWPGVRLQIVSGVPHDDMPDYYRAADCCLLTSDWEGSPNVVKEALLCGLPVVTTDVGDVGRWIPHSPESSICGRTPEDLAAGVRRVLRERRRVDPGPFLAGFSSPAVAARMLQLFQDLVDGRVNR